jgi:hypothetical protein
VVAFTALVGCAGRRAATPAAGATETLLASTRSADLAEKLIIDYPLNGQGSLPGPGTCKLAT